MDMKKSKLLNWLVAGFLALAPINPALTQGKQEKSHRDYKISLQHSQEYDKSDSSSLDDKISVETGRGIEEDKNLLYLSIAPSDSTEMFQVDLIVPDYFRIKNPEKDIKVVRTIKRPLRNPELLIRGPNLPQQKEKNALENLQEQLQKKALSSPSNLIPQAGNLTWRFYQYDDKILQKLKNEGKQVLTIDKINPNVQARYYIHYSINHRQITVETPDGKATGLYPPRDVEPEVYAVLTQIKEAQEFSSGRKINELQLKIPFQSRTVDLDNLITRFYDFHSPPLEIPTRIDLSGINPGDGKPDYKAILMSGTNYLIIDDDSVKSYRGFSIGPSTDYYLNIKMRRTNKQGIYMGRFNRFPSNALHLFKHPRD